MWYVSCDALACVVCRLKFHSASCCNCQHGGTTRSTSGLVMTYPSCFRRIYEPISPFTDYPHWDMKPELKTYYLMQAAYWCQQLIVLLLGLEKPRKDYYELVAHHFVTLWLVGRVRCPPTLRMPVHSNCHCHIDGVTSSTLPSSATRCTSAWIFQTQFLGYVSVLPRRHSGRE